MHTYFSAKGIVRRRRAAGREASRAAQGQAGAAPVRGLGETWRRLAGSRSASVGLVIAFALPAVIGMVGLGVEVGLWYMTRRQVQTATDAAAVAAAFDLAFGNGAAVQQTAVRLAAKNDIDTAAPNGITAVTPPPSGSHQGDTNAVQVTLTLSQPLLFSQLLSKSSVAVTITGRAVADTLAAGDACILALDPAASGAVDMGGNTVMTLRDCVVAANSNSSSAILIDGHAQLTATSLRAVGGYTVGGSARLVTGKTPATGTAPLPDPYADLQIASPGGCTQSNYRAANHSSTIGPGVYCGGMTIGSQSDLTMTAGTYYVLDGDVTINAGAVVSGQGVTIVLTTRSTPSQIGSVTINGGATVTLSAPAGPNPTTAAPYPGVVVFQDRRASTSGVAKFNGGATMSLAGAIYFPQQLIQFNGNNGTNAPACTKVIGRLVTFTGNAAVNDDCGGTAVRSINTTVVEIAAMTAAIVRGGRTAMATAGGACPARLLPAYRIQDSVIKFVNYQLWRFALSVSTVFP